MATMLQHLTGIDAKLGELEASKLAKPIDGVTFDPANIDLSQGAIEYNRYLQSGATVFTLNPGVTPGIGGVVTVNIRGDGSAVTFSSPFLGIDALQSGSVLETGVDYPFYFRFAPDWEGAGVDRVIVGAIGLRATPTQDGIATAEQVAAQLVPSSDVKTANFTGIAGTLHKTNTSGGSFVATFPAGAAAPVGCRVGWFDLTGSWAAFPLVLTCSDGSTIDGYNPTVDTYSVDGGNALAWIRTSASTWQFAGQTGLVGGATGAFVGQIIAGNVLLQGTRSGTALSAADSGGDFISGAPLTIPNTPGWYCDLEIGANTHDITHNSLTLDISAAGFVAGELYSIRVRASDAIRVIGPAGQFTEADFA